MSDADSPEISQSIPAQLSRERELLDPARRAVFTLLTQYTDTLNTFITQEMSPQYTREIEAIKADFAFTQEQLARATIDIFPKPVRDGDERIMNQGGDVGKTVRIQLGKRTVFINLQGGVRISGAPMDYRDSSGASKAGVSHTDRTDRIVDNGYEININVQKANMGSRKELAADVKLFLQPKKTTLQVATSGGFYPNEHLVWRNLTDLAKVRLTNEAFVPSIKEVRSFDLSSD